MRTFYDVWENEARFPMSKMGHAFRGAKSGTFYDVRNWAHFPTCDKKGHDFRGTERARFQCANRARLPNVEMGTLLEVRKGARFPMSGKRHDSRGAEMCTLYDVRENEARFPMSQIWHVF
ncbi:hypothetical protein D8674_004761 [Pyrus ussuriensis x Pyrus communis]|uniref:Uncharacterized protein n=1 Tax=Pyrus ussuriensis x Pyrus communis TaxID=2448454 RepID=A0A5N5G3A7_9ROSA|nr:hypothetical protein D8674_004761 [Pyrus ussuriensis x Pyrus communis]